MTQEVRYSHHILREIPFESHEIYYSNSTRNLFQIPGSIISKLKEIFSSNSKTNIQRILRRFLFEFYEKFSQNSMSNTPWILRETLRVIVSELYEELSQTSQDTLYIQDSTKHYFQIPRSILLEFLEIFPNLKRKLLPTPRGRFQNSKRSFLKSCKEYCMHSMTNSL